MLRSMKQSQNGFGIISLILLIGTMVFGYVVISRVLANEQVQQASDTATEVIESASQKIDTASETIESANQTIEGASQLIGN